MTHDTFKRTRVGQSFELDGDTWRVIHTEYVYHAAYGEEKTILTLENPDGELTRHTLEYIAERLEAQDMERRIASPVLADEGTD